MTSTASIDALSRVRVSSTSYRHAHWYFLAVLAVTIAGFWSAFFRNPSESDFWHALHGTTATAWVVALALQSWLMSHGYVRWHRRVARGAIVVAPLLVVSALYMVRAMARNTTLPPFGPPQIVFVDLPLIAFFVVLVFLGLRNTRTPAAHQRFMSATVLLSFPATFTRLYARVLFPEMYPPVAFQASFVTAEVVLVALIVADWRAGERRLAYPLSLAVFVAIHVLMVPVSASGPWRAVTAWIASIPI
jgi:hypothetical protein